MAKPRGLGHFLAQDALRSFPNQSSRGIARVLYHNHQESFPTYESAYLTIRYLRGTRGSLNRAALHATGNTEFVNIIPPGSAVDLPEAFPGLDWEPYLVAGTRILCISDIHLPYHDVQSLRIVIKDAKRFKIDAILINGDLLDSYPLSKFPKDPTKPRFSEDIKTAQNFLKYLRQEFQTALIYWKFGNHDLSLEKYLWVKAPELFGCRGIDLDDFVTAKDFGVEVIKEDQRVMLGKLTALHGHEFGGGSIGPVNPARGAFLKLNDSALISHFHRSSQHSETTVHEKLISCWSIGCLCRLHPQYARVNKWNLGYAFVSVDKDGNFEVDNRRIYRGRSW